MSPWNKTEEGLGK